MSPDADNLFVGQHSASLVGRGDVIAAVKERFLSKDVHLLTLTGAAGIGKTRLAVAILGEMRHVFAQVILVDLAPIGSPAQVLPAASMYSMPCPN